MAAAFGAKAGMTQAQVFSSRCASFDATTASSSGLPLPRCSGIDGQRCSSAKAVGGRRRLIFQDQKTPIAHCQAGSQSPKLWPNAADYSPRLSERIASSQYCSCSPLSQSWAPSKGPPVLRFLGKNGRVGMRRRSTAVTGDGTLLSTVRLGSLRVVRRRPRRLESGRGPQQPHFENVDIGDYRVDTDLGTDNGGGGSLGEESAVEDMGDTDSLATKIVDGSSEDTSLLSHSEGLEKSFDSHALSEPGSSQSRPGWISKRWTIVLLCFSAFLLCNMDRVNMSIAILPMSSEYHWSSTTVGLVQSSFFWGYLLTQVAGGIWADSFGGKQVLGFGVLWWSVATALTPIAAKIGLPALFFVRACMGVGEGVAMPAMNNLLSKWIPVNERSRSLALVYSGMYLGSVIGLACSPSIIQRFGWPSVFFSFGSVGVLWLFVWQQNAYSSPKEDPTLGEKERQLILKSIKPKVPLTRIPWGLLLSKPPVWALIVCHFCHNWGTFILLTWMPTYYNQVLGFNLTTSGLLSVLPWLTMAISANVGGWIADTLVGRGMSVTTVRKVMQSIGFLGPAFFLTQLKHIHSPHMAVMCMMASQGADAFSQSGLYSNHQDIGPRYSGILLGLSNTAGVLAGVVGTAATGYILQHGSWDEVFDVAVGLYIFGTVIWNLFATGEQLFE